MAQTGPGWAAARPQTSIRRDVSLFCSSSRPTVLSEKSYSFGPQAAFGLLSAGGPGPHVPPARLVLYSRPIARKGRHCETSDLGRGHARRRRDDARGPLQLRSGRKPLFCHREAMSPAHPNCKKLGELRPEYGDSVSSDCQVFSRILGTTRSHVSPPGAFFAGVVGSLRRSGPKGVGIGWSVAKSGCARPPLCGAT